MCTVIFLFKDTCELATSGATVDGELADMRVAREESAAQQFAAHYEIKVMPSLIRS